MKFKYRLFLLIAIVLNSIYISFAQNFNYPNDYNLSWTSQSLNSSESMPCGGGDIGTNVWVENGELLFYFSRSGTFDENNEFLKLGRVRVKLSPNPLNDKIFKQELDLKNGWISISGNNGKTSAEIKVWVDVYNPIIYVDINCSESVRAKVTYESWRYKDRDFRKLERFANSYKWSNLEGVKKTKDSISFQDNAIIFYHQNPEKTVVDVTFEQQGLDTLMEQAFNPLKNLTFGGVLWSQGMVPSNTHKGKYLDTDFKGWMLESPNSRKKHDFALYLFIEQSPVNSNSARKWLDLAKEVAEKKKESAKNSQKWWNDFWQRSFILIEPNNPDEESIAWQTGRNYQLFRYMLGCNAFGTYPTKFNGGLFTYDPRFTDSTRSYTPDFRNWGGGTFTAQNQRLVYFPMLKSGDFEMMKPQFDFYNRILKTAELRSKAYWGHKGACFTEQLENFGLPNCAEYGWKRPANFDKGLQYNAWLEHQWDTSLEFCLMILEQFFYSGEDISEYIDLIISCIVFFDEHYQYLARQRGKKSLDENGHIVLYPGSACETYKMAYNASSTIAGLKTLIAKTLELPEKYIKESDRKLMLSIYDRIPPVSFRNIEGYTTISPAKNWERVNNIETPQLYPVFPWGVYGIGKSGLDTARNTYFFDPDAVKFRSHVGWKQDNIFAARLGLADEAWKYTSLKLKDSGRRFPAFWGPGFDWVPDHNWGGSGMIGLQEMLMQVNGKEIYLFPAWPNDLDVHFKLHAPDNTTVEAKLINGILDIVRVLPESRMKDIRLGIKE
jgi:hypothetical protein